MFGLPIDGIILWAGLGVVSVLALGVAVGLPQPMAPDAAGVADAIDRVAASSYGATATVPVHATEIRLGPRTVSLRRAGRTSHATVTIDSLTPVDNGRLRRVLHGAPVRKVFESKAAFGRALDRDPVRQVAWRPAPGELRIRRVSWGEDGGTLVG